MVKDRLSDLHQAQDERANNYVVHIDKDANNSGKNLKKIFERAEVLGQWIDGVEQNVNSIRQYLGSLDNFAYLTETTYKIESLFQNNTSICQKITGKLKDLESELSTSNNESAEERIKLIQYNTLKTRYMQIFTKNNNELENFKNIQKTNLEKQLRAKGVAVTDEELVALLDNKTDIQVFTDNIIAETQEAKRMLADIEERHQHLLRIEHMIVEIRDLFLQMAILVENQQDMIDRVEYQANAAVEYIEKAPAILESASKHKRRNLKCKIILGIVGILLLIIIVLSFFK